MSSSVIPVGVIDQVATVTFAAPLNTKPFDESRMDTKTNAPFSLSPVSVVGTVLVGSGDIVSMATNGAVVSNVNDDSANSWLPAASVASTKTR